MGGIAELKRRKQEKEKQEKEVAERGGADAAEEETKPPETVEEQQQQPGELKHVSPQTCRFYSVQWQRRTMPTLLVRVESLTGCYSSIAASSCTDCCIAYSRRRLQPGYAGLFCKGFSTFDRVAVDV